jgi:hypothetical protein
MHFDSFEQISSGMLATSYHFPWMLYEKFKYSMYRIGNGNSALIFGEICYFKYSMVGI